MKILKTHGPIFLLMLATVFAAFGRLTTTPLWDGTDAQIICDAHALSRDPADMFGHVGFYFSQPLLQLVFLAEYRLFGLDIAGYLAVNLLIHALNAFVVYMLVNMLFPRRDMACWSPPLFALGVGSYGRVLHHGACAGEPAAGRACTCWCCTSSSATISARDGRLRSPFFIAGLALFLLSGLTRASSFSLLGCLLAYKVVLPPAPGPAGLVDRTCWSSSSSAPCSTSGQARWGFGQPTIFGRRRRADVLLPALGQEPLPLPDADVLPAAARARMLETAAVLGGPGCSRPRTVIRFALTIAIVSYSFFGFVFGSRAIRFFIAWTYITLLPFTAHTAAGRWLNLNHLYLASLGFCVVIAAGVAGCSSLLARAGPAALPALPGPAGCWRPSRWG